MPAVNWSIVTGHSCYFAIGQKQRCGEPAAIMENDHGAMSREGLCVAHMGYHLWIGDDGILYQWIADPVYRNEKKRPRVRRIRATHT